jgi:flavin reductase (DIM6/NTAB) family NADH-FMN oxidoreductase RutF
VVNVVNEAMLEGMVLASGDWPPHVDEFELAGFTPAPCDRVRPPRAAEAPAWFECRVHRTLEFGEAAFVVGEILLGGVSDEALDEHRRVVPERLAAVGRLGGDAYATLREVRRVARPRVQGGG